MLAIIGKELKAYFYSASGYVFMGIFLLICGIFFANYNLIPASPIFSDVLSSITFVFLVLVPVLTMKLIAEEKHQKTDQLLLTSPLSVSEIIVGKYLAAVLLFLISLLITVLYPIILRVFGTIAVGEIVATYVGFAFMGAALISIGLFVSSFTDNQVIAAVSSFGILLLIWIMDWIQQGLPSGKTSGVVFAVILILAFAVVLFFATRNIIISFLGIIIGAIVMLVVLIKDSALYEGFLPNFFGWFSLLKRFESFGMGMLDLSSLIYYITFSAAFVFLSIQMVEKRRWS